MIRDHFITSEVSAGNDEALLLEDGTGLLMIEEATEMKLENYFQIRGAGNLSVSGNG